MFIDQPTVQNENGTYRASAKLTVNTSLSVHGSLIRCRAVLNGEHTQSRWSKQAVLEVISGNSQSLGYNINFIRLHISMQYHQ